MMSNNKILTVSYGTFSCTLEGFDDSFEMMKLVAEYFRDLAQEDRYFGAEPPQPDAEVLAQMAQREISRNVEVKHGEDGFHLRADAPSTSGAVPTLAAAALATSEPGDAEELEAATADHADDTAENAPELEEDFATDDTISALIAGDVSADDSSEQEPMDAPEDDISSQSDVVEETATNSEANPEDAITEHDEIEAFMQSGDAAEDGFEDAEAALDAEAPAPDGNSILSKLQRIRDVVAKNQAESDGYTEDEHAEDTRNDADAAAEDDEAGDVDSAHVTDDVTDEEEVDQTLSNIAAFTSNPAQDDAPAEAAADADEATDEEPIELQEGADNFLSDFSDEYEDLEEDADPAEDSVPTTGMIGASFNDAYALMQGSNTAETGNAPAMSEADDEDELDEADLEDIAAELENSLINDLDIPLGTSPDDNLFEENAKDQADADLSDLVDEEDETEAQAGDVRGRIIKVKRTELAAALENGLLEENAEVDDLAEGLEDLDDLEDDIAIYDETSEGVEALNLESVLSQEDEDDLLRDLAEVEAELEADDEEHADASSAASILEAATGTEEDELDRLMAEADSQMEEPEGSSRRDAFSHLRAAVVATKSDDKLSEDPHGEDEDNYRDDLAAAVKPRRPVSDASSRSDRPQSQRPAPLKLVAEQRIDTSSVTAEGPVRPRRVATTELEDADAVNSSFAEYAAHQGATELSDLLEAAAAYLSFVEGKEQFSRPQLMTKVRQVEKSAFSREEGLRSFGQLLRSGKIEKIAGGRFTVSEDIGFQPDHRAAG